MRTSDENKNSKKILVAYEESQAVIMELRNLVILRHTYPDNYWEYDIARNIVLHDKPYWCSGQYGYLEHPRYSTRPYRVVAWHELPKVPNWAINSKEIKEV